MHFKKKDPQRIKKVRPMRLTKKEQIFGHIPWAPDPIPVNPERIRIYGNWVKENIVRVEIPQLVTAGLRQQPYIHCNKKIAWQLQRLWQSWEEADRLQDIKSFDGLWVPRLVRGSKRRLSNHAYGTAFDINARWNHRGHEPAKLEQFGTVLRLVAIAQRWGFFWGGKFRNPDGMHFEIYELRLAPDQDPLEPILKVLETVEAPDHVLKASLPLAGGKLNR